MPNLSVTKTYQDGDILTEADLDNIRESIETFFNTTGIDTDNIQAGGVNVSDIGINDGDYLEFGTGNDGRIGAVSDDLIIENVTLDKDIIFKANDGGVSTEVMRLDGSESALLLNNKKITGLANGTAATDAATYGQLKERVPVGTIFIYSKASAPAGWLLCDGSAVSRTTYADLFAEIGITAGEGDTTSTFNVPDLRGRFLRGLDGGANRDPDKASRTAMNSGGNTGNNMFSIQSDEFKSHYHLTDLVPNNTGGSSQTQFEIDGNTDNQGNHPTASTGGNETRPINAYVNYIIKY